MMEPQFDQNLFDNRDPLQSEAFQNTPELIEILATKSLTPEEQGELAEIYARAFAGPPWFERWDQISAEQEIKELVEKDSLFIFTRERGVISAFTIAYELPRFRAVERIVDMGVSPQALYFAEIAVRPQFQGEGRAKFLVEQLLALAARSGRACVVAQTRPDNTPMIKVFESRGFEAIGEHNDVSGGKASPRMVFQWRAPLIQ